MCTDIRVFHLTAIFVTRSTCSLSHTRTHTDTHKKCSKCHELFVTLTIDHPLHLQVYYFAVSFYTLSSHKNVCVLERSVSRYLSATDTHTMYVQVSTESKEEYNLLSKESEEDSVPQKT